MSALPQPLVLDCTGAAPGLTRRWARAALDGLGEQQLTESATLGLTELVTNAYLHARTPITVSVRRMPSERIRFEVVDGSPVLPAQARRGSDATTGRGLRLVAACGTWGVERLAEQAGKIVWFEPADSVAEDSVVEGVARPG